MTIPRLSALWALLLAASAPTIAAAGEGGESTSTPEEGLHRGVGWYHADARIPEPPLALALVIVGAWAMRRRDRRLGRR